MNNLKTIWFSSKRKLDRKQDAKTTKRKQQEKKNIRIIWRKASFWSKIRKFLRMCHS
jgi:actin-related protein